MSYEGYAEYITKEGRYLSVACHEDDPPDWLYFHAVDQTNGPCGEGEDEDCICCRPAKKIWIGDRELEHTDFKGNKYYTKQDLYKPAHLGDWQKRRYP